MDPPCKAVSTDFNQWYHGYSEHFKDSISWITQDNVLLFLLFVLLSTAAVISSAPKGANAELLQCREKDKSWETME